jgi:hypothetical protein
MNKEFALSAIGYLLLLDHLFSNASMLIWRRHTIAIGIAYPGRITPNAGT